MSIYKNDIKLFESKVMTDEDDGGGEMTGNVIVSGKHNSIFPDISDLDRAHGVVNLRSTHVKVASLNDDTYFGATVGLVETPSDPNVDITLMSVNNPYIMRDETRDIIERFLTKGAKYQGELLYTQLSGQRSVRFVQRANLKVPVAGDVLVLVNKTSGDEQYIKVEEVTSATQQFTSNHNSNAQQFTRLVVQLIITEPLRYEFVGVTPDIYDSTSSKSAVYESMVADAAKYYGLKTLTQNALLNTSEIKVEGLYTQLVPSTRVDSPHINLNAVNLVAAKYDMGNGEEAELITGVESKKIDVTINNQGYVYVATLVPIPSKGTTKVSFMAQGSWYELQDNGTGVLKGANDAYGTGQVDEFGNLTLTLGALPDVDVPILVHYQNVNNYVKPLKNSDISIENSFLIPLGNAPINTTATITWGDKSAQLENGNITGDMSGEYTTLNGHHRFSDVKFDAIPAKNTQFLVEWEDQLNPVETVEKISFVANRNIQPGNILNLPANLPPKSLKLTVNYSCSDQSRISFQSSHSPDNPNPPPTQFYNNYNSRSVVLIDDGLGNLIAQIGTLPIAGSVDYATGIVTLQKISIPFEKINRIIEVTGRDGVGWNVWDTYAIRITSREEVTLLSGDFSDGDVVYCRGIEQSTSPAPTEVFAGSLTCGFHDSFPLDLNVNSDTEIIEDTLAFTYNGVLYENVGSNSLYANDNWVGSIDLETGIAFVREWQAGDGTIELVRGAAKTGVLPESQYSLFRTAGNPVASQSLQVNAVNLDGSNINATTDTDGYISSPTKDFEGYIESKTGVVELTASALLDTNNIKYNCVSYNYLPLDADQLGLDSIRLPSDGRVVIFEKGDVVVIHQDEHLLIQADANTMLNLDHVRLASCTTNADDAVIDLDAGTISFPTAGNYSVDYRFEDMALLTYADISGLLKTSRPLSHNYDAGKAKIASVLIAGNLFARYTNLFDQKTWTGKFSEYLIGDEATAQYNDTLYPIQVTNNGCITERFAIVFTSSTSFKLIGEHVGQIAVGDINNDFAPINPTSGTPYFTLNKLGWGTGWGTGNVLRIDFYGAVFQLNIIRTILQGESENPIDSDKFELQIRGNTNKEVVL